MRLVVQARLPERRLRAALRAAAIRAAAAARTDRIGEESGGLGLLPATSMLRTAFRREAEGVAGGIGDAVSSKIDEN